MNSFYKIYKDLSKGKEVSPRGYLIKELENYNYDLQPYERFPSFVARKLSISYLKKEFLWYLKGDRYDASIINYAGMWKSVMNPDGSFNSNYGQYFFGKQNQYDIVLKILQEDKDSRRASILLLTKEHLSSKTDVPCTYAINFRIRDNYLNMTVHMRSQDSVFGMGNDAPTFSFIHEMMYNSLRETYPELRYGIYHHFADSFHIYEKHYGMLAEILKGDYKHIDCPKILNADEVRFLRKLKFDNIPEDYKFTRWLTNTL
jgi:thymidylate synthase